VTLCIIGINQIYHHILLVSVGRNCVDSTSTSYGLNGPDFEYRQEQVISSSSKSSKLALIQWVKSAGSWN